jgi:hypothetical protein
MTRVDADNTRCGRSAPTSRIRSALAAGILCLAMIESSAAAAAYFVDPVSGDDTRDGLNRETAWRTIPYAEQNAAKGSTIYLLSGNFGPVTISRSDNSGRAGWEDAITLTAYPGDSPVLNGLVIQGNVRRYVIFDKLLLQSLDANGSGTPVYIHSGQYIKIQNCEIRGVLGKDDQSRYNSTKSTANLIEMGHYITSSGIGNIFITGCNIHTTGANGMSIKGPYSGDIWIQSNEIHNFGASGIGLAGVTNGYRSYVQNNKIYIQESVWVETATVPEYYHGSGLSIRIADLTATGNILRACGASTPITCYSDGPADGYRNMVFANNLVYDSLNSAYCVRLEKIASNFVFNNNTIFGTHSDSSAGVYYYRNVLYVVSFASGCDKATVQICNNLFAGYTGVLEGTGIACVGNIFHAYGSAGAIWRDQNWLNANLPGNRVLCWSTLADNKEFRTSGVIFKGGPLFDQYATTYPNGGPHRVDLGDSFALAQGSPAIGFAHAAYAPTQDIKGVPRDSAPDAGCYEYKAGGTGPVFAAIGNMDATAGTPLTFQVSASDPNGDTLVYSASALPQGATFSGRTFEWTPTADQVGSYQVVFTVSDGQAQDSMTVTISVAAAPVPNSPPVLSAIGDKSVNENELLTFAVAATDADAQDTLSYSTAGLPSGAEFSGQTFSWRPDYSQAGSYQVTFSVTDGHAQDSETVTIAVANVDRAPALNSVSDRSVDAGNTLEFSLSAVDADGDSLAYSATGLPTGANLSGQNFTWTPAADQVGSYDITFAVSDGTLSDAKTATVAVVGTQADTTAPVVARSTPEPDAIQVPLNSLVTLQITDAGTGVDAATVAIRVNDQVVYQGNQTVYTSPYGCCSRSGSKNAYRYIYQPGQMFEFDQMGVVKVNAADLQGNAMAEYSYSYLTEMRSFGANKQLSKGSGSAGTSRPVTARDTAGNLWAAWHAGAEGSRDIYVAKLASGDDAFQTPVRLTTDGQDQCNPDLATGPDGSVYVVWQDNRRGNWDIFASVSSDRQNFSRETRVSDSNDNEVNPAVAVDGQSPNRVYVAWQDDRNGNQDIYVGISTNAFVSTAVARVTTNMADQTEPDITVGGQNTAYLVWTDMRNGQADLYGAASDAGPWTNVPIVTSASAQTDPAVAAEIGGPGLHLLWVDNAHGDQDIYYAPLAGLPGNPVTGRSIVDDTSGADQVSPAIACGANGKAFACWQDSRLQDGGTDTDLYFAELKSGLAGTNVLVGDNNTNTGQSEPAIGVNAYGHPYVVWSDDRDRRTQVYYAAATFIDPRPLDDKLVTISAGATIGTDPSAISKPEDVSIVVPRGACQADLHMTISRIINPQVNALECLGSYDFGPSGVDFNLPVTVTIPYSFSGGKRHALPYWYDALTGVLSQQGITDVENVVISSHLNALRFKTTHFTAYYLVAGDSDSRSGTGDGFAAGGCSMSAAGKGSPKELLVPYAAITTIVIILRRRDKRRQKLLDNTQE